MIPISVRKKILYTDGFINACDDDENDELGGTVAIVIVSSYFIAFSSYFFFSKSNLDKLAEPVSVPYSTYPE